MTKDSKTEHVLSPERIDEALLSFTVWSDDYLHESIIDEAMFETIKAALELARDIQRLTALNEECMIYYWDDSKKWSVEISNPSMSVCLGEVSGLYASEGPCLTRAINNAIKKIPPKPPTQEEK